VESGARVMSLGMLAVAVWLVAAAFCLYTIAVYPLLLHWLARRQAQPVKKSAQRKTVSVIIPVYNAPHFLQDKLDSILGLDYPRELMEIMVVSDGSTDQTDGVAEGYAGRGVKLLRLPKKGKPAALNAAVPLASGEILLLTDVRQLLDPLSLAHLVNCFSDPSVGVASGDLIVRKGNLEESNVGLYWRYERWIRKNLSAIDSMLGATGPFYAMRRELFVPLPEDCLLDDMYQPLVGAFLRGYRLIVDEQAMAYDYPTDVGTEFNRKVRTLAGNYQILWQAPALLSAKNRMLWHYLSCKISRMLLPWVVVLASVFTFALPDPARWFALAIQLAAIALALADRWMPAGSIFKRLTSPVGTVAAMLLAGACAVQIFFVPPQSLWKPTSTHLTPRFTDDRK
jgi:biofilm PGA synthesis N-glycosyltransferase PgaC